MESEHSGQTPSGALSLLASERPRNVSWTGAAGLLFGDWGTSRLYVLGLAFLVAGRTSFYLICAMSLLIVGVGWAYTQICRIYPDGGGVYTAGKHRARIIGVVGALLLFADYTVTASLSALDAFHYFGVTTIERHETTKSYADPGDQIILKVEQSEQAGQPKEELWHVRSPALWAIVAIVVIGGLNLLGPKHSSGAAAFTAGGMIFITVAIVAFSLPGLDWKNIQWGSLNQNAWEAWQGFVFIVLALSGVEAIANLTGVMKKPVYGTASKAIWVVALEVAVMNILLAIIMIAHSPDRNAHTEDMLAYMAKASMGPWGEWPVRIVGGLLLLSATNTAVNGLMSIAYVMSRDGELPAILQKLNGFGVPWVAAGLAALVPATVLLIFHDLTTLASLYAIGVVGAVAINCVLCAFHPRLRRPWRKGLVFGLGVLMVAIWFTLAWTKWHATVFVAIVLLVGLFMRALTKLAAGRGPQRSLLRQAIIDQLTAEALTKPKILVATAGSAVLAEPAMQHAQAQGCTLVVSFVRELAVDFDMGLTQKMTIDTDAAAVALFIDYLELGQKYGVAVIPSYDIGREAVVMIAEAAAVNGVQEVLIGSSRRGKIHQIIRGSFQRKLEALLPPEIPVHVLDKTEPTTGATAG